MGTAGGPPPPGLAPPPRGGGWCPAGGRSGRTPDRSEGRGVVARGARADQFALVGRSPRVAGRVRAHLRGRGLRVLGDLGGGVAQRRADLVDGQLHHGALLAVLGLERALLQAPLDDDAGAAGQGLGDVLGRLAPDGAAHEQRLAVLPLAGRAVEGARGGGDGEVRDRRAGGGEAQFGVGGEVAAEGDDGVAGHGGLPGARWGVERGAASARSGRGSPSGDVPGPGSSARREPARC
jgi:hypothetical protein